MQFGWDDIDAYLESRPARVVDEQLAWLARYPYGPRQDDWRAAWTGTMARAAGTAADLPGPEKAFPSLREDWRPPREQTAEEQQALARAWTIANGGRIIEAK